MIIKLFELQFIPEILYASAYSNDIFVWIEKEVGEDKMATKKCEKRRARGK